MLWKIGLLVIIVNLRQYECLVEPFTLLPDALQDNFNIYHQIGDLTKQPGQPVFWNCIQQCISKFVQSRPGMTPTEATFFRDNINNFMGPVYGTTNGRKKRQAGRPRRRREIRVLSNGERNAYFAAVNALKRDTRIRPNIYDVLANFHRGDNIARAHFGPAFPAWHRLYLWLFESFLRLYNPRITVPYWASVLDDGMTDATESVIWSPAFFGNGNGEPNNGPFASWQALNPEMVFTRNIGSSTLMTFAGIERIVSRTRNSQILLPTPEADSNFEEQHGGPHRFVGGSMNNLNEAVRDPIFYSHHSFVDMVWETFRMNQRSNGTNPQTDYPWIEGDPRFRPQHNPTAMMGFFPDNPEINYDFQNRIGYLNVWFQLVRYDPIPTCPACGGSPFLFCNQNVSPPRCVSRRITEMRGPGGNLPAQQQGRKRRQAFNEAMTETCQRKPFLYDIDTKYLGDGVTQTSTSQMPFSLIRRTQNTDRWVHIAVKIVTKRSPTYQAFPDYSLYNDHAHQNLKNTFSQTGNQVGYESCGKHEGAVGKITIVSYGLNYYGYSEEYVIFDNRLGMTESTGFVSIKAPSLTPSDAIIAAFDSCGRVCTPYCRTNSLDGSTRPPFAGGVRVTKVDPLLYGRTYADATRDAWSVPSGRACPKPDYNNVPISFFCDFTDSWMWYPPTQTPFQTGRDRPGASIGTGTPRSVVVPFRGSPSLTHLHPDLRYAGRGAKHECVVSSHCVIPVPCFGCVHYHSVRCHGGLKIAICFNNRYSHTSKVATVHGIHH